MIVTMMVFEVNLGEGLGGCGMCIIIIVCTRGLPVMIEHDCMRLVAKLYVFLQPV